VAEHHDRDVGDAPHDGERVTAEPGVEQRLEDRTACEPVRSDRDDDEVRAESDEPEHDHPVQRRVDGRADDGHADRREHE